MVGRCRLTPIKPKLKAPGIKLLKLKYDKPLSDFAFKFNLRRYIMARAGDAYMERMKSKKAEETGARRERERRRHKLLVDQSKAGSYTRPLLSST